MKTGALIEPITGRRWEAAEAARQIAVRAGRYRDLGVAGGDRVFLLFGNRLEFFADLLAIWRLGATAIPLDSRLTPFEVETIATAAKPRLSLIDADTNLDVVRTLSVLGVATTETPADALSEGAVSEFAERLGELDDDALILFTSGSTGDPKGVVHSHRTLRARWSSLEAHLGLEAFQRTLCLLPTHFGHGLICNCLFPWLSGCDLFITPPFRPEILMRLDRLIDDHDITFLSSVPMVWQVVTRLTKRPQKGTLRRLHCGSAPLSAAQWQGIRSWAGTDEVSNTYGITETGSWVAGTTSGDITPEDGLIGEPWGAEIKICAVGRTGAGVGAANPCGPGEVGYVWLRTPALMTGYFRRDDLTRAAIEDGWFLTGDIGLVDDRGLLYLKGRERDEINKGGVKVYPADIDAVVEKFGATVDVCTFAFDDPNSGQNIGIALVLLDDKPETLRGLYEWTRLHLAEHKVPARWYLVDELPRSERGKVNRETVRDECSALSPVDLAASRASTGAAPKKS